MFGLINSCNSELDRDIINELENSPEELIINEDTLKLEAYLYRNFMPIVIDPSNLPDLENHSSLISINKLQEENGNQKISNLNDDFSFI
ncbi:MAG: hypothetical protein KAS71_02505 [Bacteroidales bacterium]|nr:hypothetical protein [Bacteroidales bacterium]